MGGGLVSEINVGVGSIEKIVWAKVWAKICPL